MASYNNEQTARAAKPRKLLLKSLFKDAQVRVEPEEPQKVLVAGLAEAKQVKQYPDTFFSRGFKVLRGEFGLLFKSSLFFILFTLPFAVILFWFAGYFENHIVFDGTYNFMGGIGVGYPFGAGDNIALSVRNLYWEVKEPVYMMLAATLIIGAIGWSGLFYAAKRSYYQDYYKKAFRTYGIGFAKHWWRFLLFGGVAILVGAALVTALMNLLAQQQISSANAGDYCAVVFSFIFGVPIIMILLVALSLSVSYQLSVLDSLRDAIVVIVNNIVSSIIVLALSVAPLLLLLLGQFFSIVTYIAMALIGFTLMALMWTALVNRGMVKCHNRFEDGERASKQAAAKAAKSGKSQYVGAGAPAKKKQKKQAVHYQNPKKKKKNK